MNERVVGNFKILSKVGEGGMGSVYRGVDMMLDRDVAIKVLRPELARDPQLVERFRKEAKTLAKLSHPAVAMIYSFFREGDEFFLVMEFVEGRTLDKVLRSEGAFDPGEAVRLFGVILEGIATAHRGGVIHRDIKPENIMVTPDGAAKIMDFGIAWMVGHARMTRAGHLVGTPHYMSPEQVRGEDPGVASDIYSLGAVLYEMVTGQLPLIADSDFEIMRAHIERDPQPPREVSESVPIWLNDAILRALAKHPDARFPDATEFAMALARGGPQEGPGGLPTVGEKPTLDTAAVPPTRLAEAPPTRLADSGPPPTRLAGSGPPPTRLAEPPKSPSPAAETGGKGDGLRRAITWFVELGPAYWALGAAVLIAGIVILALIITVFGGRRGSDAPEMAAATATPLTVADSRPSQPGVVRQGPLDTGRSVPLPEPVAATPTRAAAQRPDPIRPTPKPAEPQQPAARATAAPTPVPEPTRDVPTPPPVVSKPTEPPSTDGGSTPQDPRDGAPSIGEAADMAREVEAATDSLTKTLRRFLESNDRWRPEGADRTLWEEIKTLETATDRFKSYVRKRQGLKKLRKDTHPTGWTKNEIAEARARVRDMAGRIPHIDAALRQTTVMPLIQEMWRATRDEVEKLDRQMSSH